MRTKKGGPADRMGIRSTPNVFTLLHRGPHCLTGPGPHACFDGLAKRWDQMCQPKSGFKPIRKNDLPKINLITG